MSSKTALDLYNVSLESRGYSKIDSWLSIHPSVRQEFEAIAKSVAA